jgi:DNA polymerase III delta subunit
MSQKLARLHWVSGSDDFRRREQLKRILEAEIPEGMGDFNYDRLDGRQASAERILCAARTPPMMAERRVLHVEDLELLGRDSLEALLTCAEEALERQQRGADDLSLVLSVGVGKSLPPQTQHIGQKIKAIAGHVPALDAFDENRGWPQAIAWCRAYAKERLGRDMDQAAASALTSALGILNTGRLANEMDKLAILAGDGPIDQSLVERVVGVEHGRDLWALCDAVGERDLTAALGILPEVLRRPDHEGVRVSINLGYRISKIGLARSMMDETQPERAIREKVGYPADKIVAQARRWTVDEVDQAMDALLVADLELKSGSRDREALESFLHNALTPVVQRQVPQVFSRARAR